MKITIAYALPETQTLLEIDINAGASVQDAITQSGILTQHPEINLAQQKVGVFNRVVPLTHLLTAGDRVEIYRPLLLDPKQARLLRAQRAIRKN